MARTSHTSTNRRNAARVALKAKALGQKKAKKMIANGRSLNATAAETHIPKSTLQYQRKKFLLEADKAKVYPPALRKKIVCSVLNYVHKELLKKPRVYLRRPNSKQESNKKVFGFKEVDAYLQRHWKTARPDGQLPLQSKDWIPKKSHYYELLKIIPSPSQLRQRQNKSRSI